MVQIDWTLSKEFKIPFPFKAEEKKLIHLIPIKWERGIWTTPTSNNNNNSNKTELSKQKWFDGDEFDPAMANVHHLDNALEIQ